MAERELSPEEAVELAAGIREEWLILQSLLLEAEETQAWMAAGYDRPTEWLGELPPMPSLTMRVGEIEMTPTPANRRAASVSRPGRNREARSTRRGLT